MGYIYNGRHNRVKFLVFYAMRLKRFRLWSVRELANFTECDYQSLMTLFQRWRKWNYVRYYIPENRIKPVRYYLTGYGRAWLERSVDYIPHDWLPLIQDLREKAKRVPDYQSKDTYY